MQGALGLSGFKSDKSSQWQREERGKKKMSSAADELHEGAALRQPSVRARDLRARLTTSAARILPAVLPSAA